MNSTPMGKLPKAASQPPKPSACVQRAPARCTHASPSLQVADNSRPTFTSPARRRRNAVRVAREQGPRPRPNSPARGGRSEWQAKVPPPSPTARPKPVPVRRSAADQGAKTPNTTRTALYQTPSIAALHPAPTLAIAATLALTQLILPATTFAQQPPPPSADLNVTERLAVRETGVLLDLPSLKRSAISKLQPADLIVSQSNRQLQVTRIARLDETTEPWTILVYADALSSRPRTIRLATQALTLAAEQLTQLGPVSIVAAAAEDQSLLDNERDPERVADALTQLGNMHIGTDTLGAIRRTQAHRAIEDVFFEELSFLRERADRLLVHAASVCSLPPCLLLNISDGFELAPSAVYRGVPLPQLTRGVGGATHGEIASELEQGLAARGWTVLSLALEPTELDPTGPKGARERRDIGSDYDAWKATTPGVKMGKKPKRGNRHDRLPSQALEVYVEPRLEPLRMLGSATAGATLRIGEQVPIELARLFNRWWLFYLTEPSGPGIDTANPGSVVPLSVTWAPESQFQSRRALKKRLGFIPKDEPLRVQRWARHPSPRILTEARLRSLRRGRYLVGKLEILAAAPNEVDISIIASTPLDLPTPAAVSFKPLGDKTKVRISAIGPAGTIRHQEFSLPASSDGGLTHLDLPIWARRSPAILEELGTGRWAVLTRP